jgi:hypothetical protein
MLDWSKKQNLNSDATSEPKYSKRESTTQDTEESKSYSNAQRQKVQSNIHK